MQIGYKNPEGYILRRFELIEDKIKNSFEHISSDIDKMKNSIISLRKLIHKKEKEEKSRIESEQKIRSRFEHDVDEFTQKTTQLSLALSEIRAIRNEVVVVRDLAKIEERIKSSFKIEIEEYKSKLKEMTEELKEVKSELKKLDKGSKKKEKKGWFGGK